MKDGNAAAAFIVVTLVFIFAIQRFGLWVFLVIPALFIVGMISGVVAGVFLGVRDAWRYHHRPRPYDYEKDGA